MMTDLHRSLWKALSGHSTYPLVLASHAFIFKSGFEYFIFVVRLVCVMLCVSLHRKCSYSVHPGQQSEKFVLSTSSTIPFYETQINWDRITDYKPTRDGLSGDYQIKETGPLVVKYRFRLRRNSEPDIFQVKGCNHTDDTLHWQSYKFAE